jgi:chromosome segregation ATPase
MTDDKEIMKELSELREWRRVLPNTASTPKEMNNRLRQLADESLAAQRRINGLVADNETLRTRLNDMTGRVRLAESRVGDLCRQIDVQVEQRQWWSGVARAYARKQTVTRIVARVLGGAASTRQRRITDLQRTIDALIPDDVTKATDG